MNIAFEIAKNSTCKRKQVGAVLVKEGRIISTGYNGTVKGAKHCNDLFKNYDKNDKEFFIEHGKWSGLNEIHAELNAILWAARHGIDTEGSVIYITLSTCINCAKAIIQAGVKEVYYSELYDRETDGLDFLIKNKIKVTKI